MTEESNNRSVSPFACELKAIPAEQRPVHLRTAQQLFQSVRLIRELVDGYAFQLNDEPDALMEAALFISRERLCCPFFTFALTVEAEGGLWLHLTGREGVKEFVRAEIAEFVGNDFAFESLLVAVEVSTTTR